MSPSAATRLRAPAASAALDVLLIVIFAALGRRSHDESGAFLGVLGTAWPFLAGAALGWLVVRLGRKDWPVSTGPGLTVWFAALVIGMVLRRATGHGTALAFVIVAAVALGLFLVGRRAVLDRLVRGPRGTGAATGGPVRSG